jgi:NAD(P)-dependent dehydrogenase (short-subunit alcohol dehydrogenase family)
MSENQIALVTGASRGIGREIARRLAALGMTVYAGARSRVEGDVRALRLDVTDDASVAAAAERIAADEGRLDVLVNNAGISIGGWVPSEETVQTMRDTYAVNVFGVVAVTHAMLPLLRRSPAARIVNLSSELGSLTLMSDPNDRVQEARLLAYNSSKSALNAITVLYANELRDSGILVNAVSPGYVATDLNDFRGHLGIEEGAEAPVRLATLDRDGPTGAFLSANGPIPW